MVRIGHIGDLELGIYTNNLKNYEWNPTIDLLVLPIPKARRERGGHFIFPSTRPYLSTKPANCPSFAPDEFRSVLASYLIPIHLQPASEFHVVVSLTLLDCNKGSVSLCEALRPLRCLLP